MKGKKSKSWDEIYREEGIVQTQVMDNVQELVRYLSDIKKKELILLDLGCGTGRHFHYISNKLSKRSKVVIEAFDISKKACDLLSEALVPNNNVRANIFHHNLDEGLPYNDEYFDAIICTLVIEHGSIAQIKERCKEIKRVLKKGGVLALSVPSLEHPIFLTGVEVEKNTKINTSGRDGGLLHHFFTKEEIEEYLFYDFDVLYGQTQTSSSVTKGIIAKHFTYLLEK